MTDAPDAASATAGVPDTTRGGGVAASLREVWRSPFHRGATMAMFLSGVGTSAAAPQIARFLVNDLHASLPTAGIYYLTSMTAPVAGYLVGSRSDRTGRRLGLFRLCAMLGFAGWMVSATATRLWVPFVVSALVLAFGGSAASQLFAALHDELQHTRSTRADAVVSVVRMALTAGWVVGPVLGQTFAAATSLRAMLIGAAVVSLLQVVPMGVLRDGAPAHVGVPGAVPDSTQQPHQRPSLSAMLPLLAFTGLYVCVYGGESTNTPTCPST